VVPLIAAAIIGTAGLAVIKTSEGRVLKTYLDPVGIPTACYGHTGPEVKLGQTYTPAQCDALLLKDIAKHQVYIVPGAKLNCIGNRRLTPNQRDALISFVFNVGGTKFCGSTMAKRLKAGNMIGAADEFPKWKYAGGRVLRGLEKRREAERRLFLTIPRPDPAKALSGNAKALLT
jgi:lysozyme